MVDAKARDEEDGEVGNININSLNDTFANPFLRGDNSFSINSVNVGFGELAALNYCVSKVSRELQSIGRVKVPHMLFDNLRWVKSRPPKQPHIKLTVRVDTRSYRDNDIRPPSAYKHRTADMTSLADTGCQALVMGPQQLTQLGLTKCDLMECEQRLTGANGGSIVILGAVFIVVSGTDNTGKVWRTRQLCYVCEGVSELLLSREACTQLGMIPEQFPGVGCADRKSTRLNSSHSQQSRMPSSA